MWQIEISLFITFHSVNYATVVVQSNDNCQTAADTVFNTMWCKQCRFVVNYCYLLANSITVIYSSKYLTMHSTIQYNTGYFFWAESVQVCCCQSGTTVSTRNSSNMEISNQGNIYTKWSSLTWDWRNYSTNRHTTSDIPWYGQHSSCHIVVL